jgi:hypothetical protein
MRKSKSDEVTMRLLVNIDGTDKSYFLANGTEAYYKKLRAAYKDVQKGKKTEYLFFGFFTLCAATLEYSLNYLLTDFCVNQFGPQKYKSYAEGYINISFGKKLLMTPNILSGGQFVLNEDDSSYKTLTELISLRNKILHNREFLNTFDFPSLTELKEKKQDKVEFQISLDDNHIDSLTKEKCLRFGNALADFKRHIMTPALNGELSVNKMIVDIRQKGAETKKSKR